MIEALHHDQRLQFSGPREAARRLNLDPSAISKCVRGQHRTHKGWTFRLIDPYIALEAFIRANCERSGDYTGGDWIQMPDLLARYSAAYPGHEMSEEGLVAAFKRHSLIWFRMFRGEIGFMPIVTPNQIHWLKWR